MSDRTGEPARARVDYDEEVEEVPTSWLRRQWEQVHGLLFAVLIALAIRAFLIEPFRIPSGSMLPTLLVGDHLFVNKFVYGVKIPFTAFRLPEVREPRRGDVIVFTVARDGNGIYPADRRADLGREEFVKRIVAVEGDTVEVQGGELRVNGQAVESRREPQGFEDEVGRRLQLRLESVNGHRYHVLDDPTLVGLPQNRTVVEPGRYFVMGDNRDHSNDSRAWGTVRKAEIKGPAFVLYWSWDWDGRWRELLNPLTWWNLLVHKTRWERIGDKVP